MNIGIDIRELQANLMTGIGRYLVNFLYWAIPQNPDCSFYLYGNQDTYFQYVSHNVTLRIIPEQQTLYWDQVTLPRQIRQDKLDVFLSPYIKGPIFSPAPLITTMHDLLFLSLPEYRKNIGWELTYKCFARLVGESAKAVITDSLYSQNDIVRLLKLPRQKIKVIPLAVAPEYYQPVEAAAIEQLRQKAGISGRYILYVGNFKPHKNIQRLVKAYAGLDERLRQEYRLVLCGRPDSHCLQLRQLIQELKIEDEVIFPGMVTKELPALYRGADLFVFPSLYEGFGLPVAEAMACGVAVVTSNVTSLPEVAGDSAVLIDPRNTESLTEAMSCLLTDQKLRAAYVQRGLQRAQLFHPNKFGPQVLALLKDIRLESKP